MKPDLEFAEGVYTIITGFMNGADYVIGVWKDGRLKYQQDEPLAVKALEML